MTAEIIPLRPLFLEPCPYSLFRKALMAIVILAELESEEVRLVIAIWMVRGLISEDEAAALNVFFGL